MKTQAKIGSISHGTIRTQDLLNAFASELERLSSNSATPPIVEEARGYASDDDDSDAAREVLTDLADNYLSALAPPYCYFGNHWGDASDFGFWPIDIEEIKKQVEFVSSNEQGEPDQAFRGEWLHVNERGNCTLYFRGERADIDGNCKIHDTEVWALV